MAHTEGIVSATSSLTGATEPHLVEVSLSNRSHKPRITACTNKSDGCTSYTDEGGNILDVDANQGQEFGNFWGISLPDAVAALERSSVSRALALRGIPASRCGGRKSGEGESDKREVELHVR